MTKNEAVPKSYMSREIQINYMKNFLLSLLFFFPLLGFCQTQIGADIDGNSSNWEMGSSVAASADGNVVAMGAAFVHRVRVYRNVSGSWTQIGADLNGFDRFGACVSLSADGTILAVGDHRGSKVSIFQNISGTWTPLGNTIASFGEQTGYSISLSADGNFVAVGSIYSDSSPFTDNGQVRVFQNIAGTWTLVGGPIRGEASSDLSGFKVSLSADGSVVAIGAPNNDGNGDRSGHARVFRNVAGIWTQVGSDIDGEAAGDESGWSVSLSADGNTVAVGAHSNDAVNAAGAGHVRVYKNISATWTKIGQDIDGQSGGNQSGFSVSLSADGKMVAVGSPYYGTGSILNTGNVRVFRFAGNMWYKMGRTIDGEGYTDQSGWDVALAADGSKVVIGAPFNNGNGLTDSGQVRIYSLAGLISANDECANAIALTPDAVCIINETFNGTFKGSTMSGAAPSCAPLTIRDVWFKFTATTATMGLESWIEVGNPAFEIYEGSCNGTLVTCRNTSTGDTENYTTNYTIGQEYFVRFFETDPIDNERNFPICLKSYPGPANDLCANATTLTPGLTCNFTSGNFTNASLDGAAAACASGALQDVWYKFTATDATMGIELSADGGNPALQIYQGGCNGTVVACSNNLTGATESYFNNNFVVGQQYYIRILESVPQSTTRTFSICVKKYPTPVNDLCSNATQLTPGLTCSYTAGTFSGSLLDGGTAVCAPNTLQDAWYKFTATDVTMGIDVSAEGGNPAIEIYQGGCNGTVVACSNSNNGFFESYSNNNFIVGQQYYIRVIESIQQLTTRTFSICVKRYPAPANDLCANAVQLAPSSSCSYVAGTFSGSLPTGSVSTCAPTAAQDAWYKFTATSATMSIQVSAETGNPALEIYQGSCNGNIVACDNSDTNFFESYSGTNFIVGQQYYIRVIESVMQLATHTFSICLIGPAEVACTPSVAITASAATVCAGGTVTFTAISNHGGTAPSYQWQLNGSNVGTNSPTFTTAALSASALVSLDMTSNAACASPATAVSNLIQITVTNLVAPEFTTVPAICSETPLVLPTTSVNGITGTWMPAANNIATTTYTFTPNAGQCAAAATMTVVVNSVNTEVTVQGNTITALATGATYQWLNCATNLPIAGATTASFTAPQNGSYAVTVTRNGCSKISDCISISNLDAEAFIPKAWKIYPNPVSAFLSIETTDTAEITITDMTGKLLRRESLRNGVNSIDVSTLSSGIYVIRSAAGVHLKFIKQ